MAPEAPCVFRSAHDSSCPLSLVAKGQAVVAVSRVGAGSWAASKVGGRSCICRGTATGDAALCAQLCSVFTRGQQGYMCPGRLGTTGHAVGSEVRHRLPCFVPEATTQACRL